MRKGAVAWDQRIENQQGKTVKLAENGNLLISSKNLLFNKYGDRLNGKKSLVDVVKRYMIYTQSQGCRR